MRWPRSGNNNPDRVTHRALRLLGLRNRVSFTTGLPGFLAWKGAWKTDRIKNLSIARGEPEDDAVGGESEKP